MTSGFLTILTMDEDISGFIFSSSSAHQFYNNKYYFNGVM